MLKAMVEVKEELEQPKEKVSSDKWIAADQIFLTGGQGFSVAPDGHTFLLGTEAEIKEALDKRPIPEGITLQQRREYERIFELLEELKDGESLELQRPGTFRSRIAGKAKRRATHIKPASFRKRLPGHTLKR